MGVTVLIWIAAVVLVVLGVVGHGAACASRTGARPRGARAARLGRRVRSRRRWHHRHSRRAGGRDVCSRPGRDRFRGETARRQSPSYRGARSSERWSGSSSGCPASSSVPSWAPFWANIRFGETSIKPGALPGCLDRHGGRHGREAGARVCDAGHLRGGLSVLSTAFPNHGDLFRSW